MAARHRRRADAVQQDMRADARPTPLGQRRHHVVGNGPVLEEVLRIRDGLRCRADGVDDGGEDLVTVQEDPQVVAADDRSSTVRFERRVERRLTELDVGKCLVSVDVGTRDAQRGDPGDRCCKELDWSSELPVFSTETFRSALVGFAVAGGKLVAAPGTR